MSEVNASIITIGDELLIGQTIDTNSAFIAQELNAIGIWVKRRIAVGDVREEILAALKEQSRDCKIVIITGGLGPTDDDITKNVLCEYFDASLVVNDEALQNVKNIFLKLNKPLIERNLRQAEVPDKCKVLTNKRGSAPGMWFEKENVIYVSLPGVPHEMKGLIKDSVVSMLKDQLDLPAVSHRTLLTAGEGEGMIAETLVNFEKQLPSFIRLAYLPAYGLVRLRLTGKGKDPNEIEKAVDEQFESLKKLVAPWMVAETDITLQETLSNLLRQKNKKLSTAESCTGGYIAHLITSNPGSSSIFNGSIIAYANEVKQNQLNVNPETFQKFGAVSEETVTEMAKGALTALKSDYVIATSGIMGPEGGTAEKPVGTVWIAIGSPQNIRARKFQFRFDRTRNIELTAHTAMSWLFRFITREQAD